MILLCQFSAFQNILPTNKKHARIDEILREKRRTQILSRKFVKCNGEIQEKRFSTRISRRYEKISRFLNQLEQVAGHLRICAFARSGRAKQFGFCVKSQIRLFVSFCFELLGVDVVEDQGSKSQRNRCQS